MTRIVIFGFIITAVLLFSSTTIDRFLRLSQGTVAGIAGVFLILLGLATIMILVFRGRKSHPVEDCRHLKRNMKGIKTVAW